MSTGEKIKKLRVERHMTQEQLGEKLGVKKSAVAKYENDRVRNLKKVTLLKLADIFNVNPSYFIDELKKSSYHMGSVLRRARESKGLTRAMVAKAVNLKETDVYNVEVFPDEEGISKPQKIAEYLEMDFATLFAMDEYNKNKATVTMDEYAEYIARARSNYFTNRISEDLSQKLKDNQLSEQEKIDLYKDIMFITDLRLKRK